MVGVDPVLPRESPILCRASLRGAASLWLAAAVRLKSAGLAGSPCPAPGSGQRLMKIENDSILPRMYCPSIF